MAKRKRRTFTAEYKTEVVLDALRGESSQVELCRQHNLSEDQLSKWKQQFLENAVSVLLRLISNRARMLSVSSILNTSLGEWRAP
ncbi:transposase [Candidatus Poribacteria bacterium]|nr:transposase [Candidatus Poribacteria bacterium]MYH80172.1 transposase [Candidatus Poribacteria bacterium]MYK94935.1 transposase [Candidatus Poribacteria bacterium]